MAEFPVPPDVKVSEVQVLRLQPGDVLHVKTKERLATDARCHLHHYLRERLPEGVGFIINDRGVEMEVIRQEPQVVYRIDDELTRKLSAIMLDRAQQEGGDFTAWNVAKGDVIAALDLLSINLIENPSNPNCAVGATAAMQASPCPDCNGTREYQPLTGPAEPCRTCCGR